jgi:nicotinamide-nucleotide amidase
VSEDLRYAVVAALRERHLTIATAESLTGGLLCAALTDVPGASSVVRGGVVSYATDLKGSLLGVDADLLRARGAVDPDVAVQMAEGVRRLLAADIGVATTGVAGPDPQDGRPVGTVHLAVAGPGSTRVRSLLLEGDRAAIRGATVAAALELVSRVSADTAAR